MVLGRKDILYVHVKFWQFILQLLDVDAHYEMFQRNRIVNFHEFLKSNSDCFWQKKHNNKYVYKNLSHSKLK